MAGTSGGTPLREDVLVVEGLHCGSCAAAVEAMLKRQPGVAEAAVNFAADSATVRFDTAQTDLARLQKAVARLGYRLLAPGEEGRDAGGGKRLHRRLLIRLAVALVFGMWCMMPAYLVYLAPLGIVEPSITWPLALASGLFALPVLVYSGAHFYRVGFNTLRVGAPGLDALITLAVLAATAVSVWQLARGSAHVYFDAAVMLITFQLIARFIDGRVRRRAADVVRSYLSQAPETATRLDPAGRRETLPAAEIAPGERIVLTAGEPLALDAAVLEGHGEVDQALLTGEYEPSTAGPGDTLRAGCTLVTGELELSVIAAVGERRIDALARSVRGLLSRKTALQRLTDAAARVLLPIIVTAAVLATGLGAALGLAADEALTRGLAVLIIACPCALSLAIPLVVVTGHARMVAKGVIFRDPAALETAADAHVVVFDKTGTLTTATPAIAEVLPAGDDTPETLLALAADTLHGTDHPVAHSLAAHAPPSARAGGGVRQVQAGLGTRWERDGHTRLAGRAAWLGEQGVSVPPADDARMALHLAENGRYRGVIHFDEALHPDAAETVAALKRAGHEVYLLSGDHRASCLRQAERLGIAPERVVAGVTPEAKQRFIEGLEQRRAVAFVGDGLNDGLALAGARLGMAVGDATPTAQAAAAVYLPDGVGRVPATLALARRARRLMRQNLGWALGYNALALVLAVAGLVAPVIAAAAMTLSTLCVLLNSLRMKAAR
ncbi:heavy metal translocating P-type ATPase [Halomonas cibimaris]|uniref:Heavy metal translocating P-type ATPase n=1 Tax=Halomonas cibimaris TaxID=657012 RepID=A0ABP7LY63_9GAMM